MTRYTVITEARARFEQEVEASSKEEAIRLTEGVSLGVPIELEEAVVVEVIEED